MDDQTRLILQEWGFESLTEVLREECIDHEALLALNLNSKELDQLIPKIGIRSKFKKALETYQLLMSSQLAILSPSTSDTNSDVFLPDAVINLEDMPNKSELEQDAISITNQSIERQITGLQCFENSDAPPNINIELKQDDANISDNSTTDTKTDNLKKTSNELPIFLNNGVKCLNLKAVLDATIVGKVVLTAYNVQGSFNDAARRKLVDVIITSLLSKVDELGQPITLKNEHFNDLANKIVELFPDEQKDSYYVKPQTEGPHQKISKGKLVDFYRNRLRQLRKVGLVTSKKQKISAIQDVSYSVDEESKRACIPHHKWLQHNTTPWSLVVEHWNASRLMRLNRLQRSFGTVETFIAEWPVLKQPSGYTLIESDYNEMFDDGLSLYSEWPKVSEKLQTLMKSEIKNKTYLSLLDDLKTNECTSDSRDATLLTLLPVICFVSSPIRTPKCSWKPTHAESINGFILHVQSPGDLEIARQQQEEKKAKLKLQLQPYVIVVGPHLSAIEQSYINIDTTLYLMNSPLQAVDICYKAFHVLHAKYPAESEQVWLFLQKYIYKRTTEWDKRIESVMLLTKKLDKE